MNKPLTQAVTDRIAYQKSQPKYMRPDMVIPDAIGQNDPRPVAAHSSVTAVARMPDTVACTASAWW